MVLRWRREGAAHLVCEAKSLKVATPEKAVATLVRAAKPTSLTREGMMMVTNIAYEIHFQKKIQKVLNSDISTRYSRSSTPPAPQENLEKNNGTPQSQITRSQEKTLE